jgi:lipoprotein NlpI/transglutaminase-like putative cysteine protease
MKQMIVCWLLLAAMSVSALAGAQQQPSEPALQEAKVPQDAFSKTPTPAWVVPAEIPASVEKGPVLLRLADTQFLVDASSTVFVRRAIQVNDNSALSEIGQLAIPFVPDYQKLQLHQLRILRGNQTLERRDNVNIRFLQRETRFESGIYSGVVMAALLIDDVRVGDTLDYEYSIVGVNPVFQDKFADVASWSGSVPVTRRRVILHHPAGREIRYRFLGDRAPQIEPTRERVGDNQRVTWAQDNLAAVRIEGLYPRSYTPVSLLQLSEYRSWNEVARWAHTLFGGEVVIDAELAAEIKRIKSLNGRDAQVSAALQYVQNEIRYFSVSLGESSHRPSAPQVVMKRRFGDCKDKSWLLIAMLRELGIAAQPALVSLDPFSPLRPALPSPMLFDHVIVRVEIDGQGYFVDPTRIGQAGRVARMGQIHEGAEVLLVAQDTGALSTLKSEHAAELTANEVTEQFVVAAFGKPATLSIRTTENGVGAELMRWLSKTRADDLQRALTDEVLKRYPGATLIGAPDYQDDPNDNKFTVVTRYNVPNATTENRDAWLLNFVPSNLVRIVAVPPSVQRSAPLGIGAFPYTGRYTLNVQLPKEVSAMVDPNNSRVRNKAFEFNMSERFRGNSANYEMRLQTLTDNVSPAELDGYVADVRKMLRVMGGTIIVPKRLLTTAARGGTVAGNDALGRRLVERLEERVKRYTSTISEGRIKGKDLAAAHADRGVALNELGKTAEALKDLDQAVALDDGNPEFFKSRAAVHYKRGDFQKSTADFTRALTLGAEPHALYYRRGINHFYHGTLENALADFEQSLGTADAEERLFHALWYTWTAQLMGKALPDTLRKEFEGYAQGAWPRPALAMFAGKLPPEAVLKIAEAKSGDERIMTLCEAYFYVAQHYMVQKNAAKAKEYFEKARATNVIVYIEHEAAKLELDRMAAAKP